MSRHASERPKETPEVVALQNYINMCREDKIFKLKADIKQSAERIMFLIYNATLSGTLFEYSASPAVRVVLFIVCANSNRIKVTTFS